jgi:uncharacterized protein YprB with RNaseH-like and TPR domain
MLRERIAALRRQSGAAGHPTGCAGQTGTEAGDGSAVPPAAASPCLTPGAPATGLAGTDAGEPLALRLARLTQARAAARVRGQHELIVATGARTVAEGVLLVEWRRPLPLQHGRTRLDEVLRGRLSVPLRRGDTLVLPAERLLFLDTETSGLAGGTGTFVFLLGLARVSAGHLYVAQYLATGFAGEAGLLDALAAAVEAAECLVTFNGKSFDVPVLKARYALARRPHPFEGKAHGDLLHATRRLLREGWPDCRLRTTEVHALGFDRVDDLPGAEVPAAWQRWLTRGDASAVPRILDHNREDLLSLAALVQALNQPSRASGLFA